MSSSRLSPTPVRQRTKQSYLSDVSVTSQILCQGNDRNIARSKQAYDDYLKGLFKEATNPLIESLASVNGLPLNAFLNRLSAATPFVNTAKVNISKHIEELVHIISEYNSQSSFPSQKYNALRKLREIAAGEDFCHFIRDFARKYPGVFTQMVIHCLDLEHTDVAFEACVTIAFIARKLHYELNAGMEGLIAAMVRLISIAKVPIENYITCYREAVDHHIDLEMYRSRTLPFYFPKLTLSLEECNHRIIGVLYYTIADLLYSLPSPRLIHFFECRIFHRKEMTRTVLFNILTAVVINLPELRSESERLMKLSPPPPEDLFVDHRKMVPISQQWDDLPATLYLELLRVYNDRNVVNSALIQDMMPVLRACAPIKFPLFEDDTLRALTMYTQGTNVEKLQLGRSSRIRRVDSTNQVPSQANAVVTLATEMKKKNLETNPTARVSMSKSASQTEQDARTKQEDDYGSIEGNELVKVRTTRKSEIPVKLPDIFDLTGRSTIE